MITSRHTRGASAEANTIQEQQLKRTQLGISSWSRCNWGALWSDHMRLVLARDTTAQGCWCVRVKGYAGHTMKEARPQHKITYFSSEGRTVCASMEMEVQYSSDLCTTKRAAGTGLLTQKNDGKWLKWAKWAKLFVSSNVLFFLSFSIIILVIILHDTQRIQK